MSKQSRWFERLRPLLTPGFRTTDALPKQMDALLTQWGALESVPSEFRTLLADYQQRMTGLQQPSGHRLLNLSVDERGKVPSDLVRKLHELCHNGGRQQQRLFSGCLAAHARFWQYGPQCDESQKDLTGWTAKFEAIWNRWFGMCGCITRTPYGPPRPSMRLPENSRA